MFSLKCLLAWILFLAVTVAHPTNSNSNCTAALSKRGGLGWLENSRGTEAYRCEYFPNVFFEKIHLAGRNSTHTEQEIKRAAKKAGAMTGWKWKDLGHGSFVAKVNFLLAFFFLLLCSGLGLCRVLDAWLVADSSGVVAF
jgi:hypothetical protein